MPTPDELRQAIATYVATINRRDPEAIAALFADQAHQADPASNPANVGRRAIADFFEASIGASESWTFTAAKVHTCGNSAAIDFAIDIDLGSTTMGISGIEVFTVDDDGLFTEVNAYWDDTDVTV